jgi:hypothetical protein
VVLIHVTLSILCGLWVAKKPIVRVSLPAEMPQSEEEAYAVVH